jgi:hydroxymethylglutaryl-CoA lyase
VHPASRFSSTSRTLSGKNDETTTHFEGKAKDVDGPKPTIKIVEVGPRDGLQNETLPLVSVNDKLKFIRWLERAGCSNIEVGSFVSPKWIPQMSGSSEVLSGLLGKELDRAHQQHKSSDDNQTSTRARYSVLVPNIKGLEQALSAGGGPSKKGRGIIDEIAIFGAASEEFTKRNINSTIDESMGRFREIIDRVREVQDARDNGNNMPLLVRGYVSTVITCPYQGVIKPKEVAYAVEEMLNLGCYEVSLGDTIGVGTPRSTKRMLEEVLVRMFSQWADRRTARVFV